jgi:hypothetical protein
LSGRAAASPPTSLPDAAVVTTFIPPGFELGDQCVGGGRRLPSLQRTTSVKDRPPTCLSWRCPSATASGEPSEIGVSGIVSASVAFGSK